MIIDLVIVAATYNRSHAELKKITEMKLYLEVMFWGILLKSCCSWRDPPPRAKTKQGIVEGVNLKTDTSRLGVFYGIPYAAPPIGPLRFSPPMMHQGWNKTYQAFNTKSRCPQLPAKDNENEDCLYLDIWVPQVNSSLQKPVLVFVGGVDFARDSKLLFNGQDLASRGIIVVRVTYRLNIFGFFSMGSREFRGNIGLLDQYFALLWVKENIVYFDGDSQNITLFGHHSGAASVALHMTSPRTQGLFQRALLSSGSAVSPWIVDSNTIHVSKQLVRILKCDVNTLNCMRAKSTAELLQAFQLYSESVNTTNLLSPITDVFLPVDDRYLPVTATDSFRNGLNVQIPTLIGVGSVIKYPQVDQWINLLSQGYFFLQKFVKKVKIPEILELYKLNETMRDLIANLIEWHYSLFFDIDGRFLIDQLKKLEYEAKIEAPVFQQISYMSQHTSSPTFVYSIKHDEFITDISDESITMDMVLFSGPSIVRQISKKRYSTKDIMIFGEIQEYITNFVRFGNPTPNAKRPWRKYVLHDPYVREIEGNSYVNNDRLLRKRILFWNDLLTKFSHSRYNIIQPSVSVELNNSVGSAIGLRNVILCGLLVFLLLLLIVCIILLRRKSRMMRTNSSWTIG
ncbi:liver carboxylesterase 1F-like isoform X2 [Harmonia axyridis]|uniref:liver carboxylesterase 1F-like isoform X2 n=1 Tax=Harmonia axyridis TaxID=115357 RepID=UPI001E2797FD|nr:liver carboxylesterase 1F-like isoform X2 [Harmonia axyridis]